MPVVEITREDADDLSMSCNHPGSGEIFFVIRSEYGTVYTAVVGVRYTTLVNNAIMNDNTCGSVTPE
jgi:hypothetical protein